MKVRKCATLHQLFNTEKMHCQLTHPHIHKSQC